MVAKHYNNYTIMTSVSPTGDDEAALEYRELRSSSFKQELMAIVSSPDASQHRIARFRTYALRWQGKT